MRIYHTFKGRRYVFVGCSSVDVPLLLVGQLPASGFRFHRGSLIPRSGQLWPESGGGVLLKGEFEARRLNTGSGNRTSAWHPAQPCRAAQAAAALSKIPGENFHSRKKGGKKKKR